MTPPPHKSNRVDYNSGSGPSGFWLHTEVIRLVTLLKKKLQQQYTFHYSIPLFHSTIPFHHSIPPFQSSDGRLPYITVLRKLVGTRLPGISGMEQWNGIVEWNTGISFNCIFVSLGYFPALQGCCAYQKQTSRMILYMTLTCDDPLTFQLQVHINACPNLSL